MLEAVGAVSEADYAPFVRQFHHFDKTRDGRLNGDDLVHVVASTRREACVGADAAAAAQRAQATVAQQRLQEHARNLMVPTFLASFGFLWYAVFGLVLTASGLVHGLAIGMILGSLGLPPRRRPYRRIVAVVSLGAVTLVTSLVLIVVFSVDVLTYTKRVDSLLETRAYGLLDDNGYTARVPATLTSRVDAGLAAQVEHAASRVVLVLYTGGVVLYTLVVDVMTARYCMQALHEERLVQSPQVKGERTSSSTTT